MGKMGAPTTRATNYLHARRLSDIVRFVVITFGAHSMNRIALALVVAPLIVQIAALVAQLIGRYI
jgi:hypothetical protein